MLNRHREKHVEQADQIKTIEGKFAQNSAEMEVILRGRKEVAEALGDGQNAMANNMLASRKALLAAAEEATQVDFFI